jgi:hypothetical protein
MWDTILMILVFFAAVSVTAASSRQICAFSCDKGLPLSSGLSSFDLVGTFL